MHHKCIHSIIVFIFFSQNIVTILTGIVTTLTSIVTKMTIIASKGWSVFVDLLHMNMRNEN